MDQKSPGFLSGGSAQVQGGTLGRPDAVRSVESHAQAQVQDPSLTNTMSNLQSSTNWGARTDDIVTIGNQSSTNSTFHSALRQGGSSDLAPSSEYDPYAVFVGSSHEDEGSQKPSTHEGNSKAPSQPEGGFAEHRNVTAPAAYRAYNPNEQPMKPRLKFHQRETGPASMPSGLREHDPHELFLFEGNGPHGPARDGTHNWNLGQPRFGVPSQEGVNAQLGRNLRRSRDRVPTPGVGSILGTAPTNETSQDRNNVSAAFQKGTEAQPKSTQYYDYSEGFEPSTTSAPRMSTCQTLVADSGSVEPSNTQAYYDPVRDNFHHARQEGYGYPQARARNDVSSHPNEAPRYSTNPSHQGASRWADRAQRGYASHGEPHPPPYPQLPRVPTQEYAYAVQNGYRPQPRAPMGPPQYRNGGHDVHVYSYTQAQGVTYQGGSGYHEGHREPRGYPQVPQELNSYQGQHRDPGRHQGRHWDAGRHHQAHQGFKGGYSNENMPPSHAQAYKKAATRNHGPNGQRHAISQAHRKVQGMMKQSIPRSRGQENAGHDRSAFQVPRPISIVAPRPVAYSITQRLEQHVLSIDDDDKLPAGLRNLQHGPSGPSDDDLSEYDAAFLCRPEIDSELETEALIARTIELRRPRLIARMDSTRQEKKNVTTYAPPRNIDFQESSSSRGRTPYPADTFSELEYQGIIRAKPKLHSSSDAGSRSITKPEQDVWKSTKSKIGSATEDVLAKLGIKTKRVRDAEKRGYTPLTRQVKASIPSSEHPDILNAYERDIEQWRSRASGEDGGQGGHPKMEAEELRDEAYGNRANTTTAEGYAAAHQGVRNRFSNLKVRAFRSKPELRAKM